MLNNEDARFLSLLEKWQSGDFSRKDARELEELTRDDAFRKEAWEGFRILPEENHQKTLNTLRLRLRQKYNNKPGAFSTRMLLSAAATLLLLLASVWLFRSSKHNTALVELGPSPQTDSLPDSNTYTAIEDKSHSKEIPITDNQTIASNSARSRQSQTGKAPSSSPAGTTVQEQPSTIMEDHTSSQADIAVQREAEVKDDAPAVASESEKINESATKPLEKKMPATPAPEAAMKKKEKSAWSDNKGPADMDKLRKEARKKQMPARTEPGGGWEMFNDYLRQNARLTPQAAAANVSGTVRLQFSVNDNGEPQGIIVLRSLGYGLDQEARRLVENWVWVKGIDSFISVDIPFSR